MPAQYGVHPYQYNKIYTIDGIQCRTAHWSLHNYDRYSSVTLVQHQFSWQSVKKIWTVTSITIHNYVTLHIPSILLASYLL